MLPLPEPTTTTVEPRTLYLPLPLPLGLGFLLVRGVRGERERVSVAAAAVLQGIEDETHFGGGGLILPLVPTTMTRGFEPTVLTPPTTLTEPPRGVGTESTFPAPKDRQLEQMLLTQLTPLEQQPKP